MFHCMGFKLLLFAMLSPSVGDIRQPKFHVLQGKLDFTDAVRSCYSLPEPGEWSLPDSYEAYSPLSKIMSKDQIKSVWLGIRKFTFASWRWVDGTLMNEPIKFGNATTGCGAINKHGILLSVNCTNQRSGSICELPGESHCPSRPCFWYEDHLLMIGCQAGSWFSTRKYCNRHGGDMSVFKSSSKINFIVNKISKNMCSDDVTLFFIGLHKEDWISVDSHKIVNIGKLEDKDNEENNCAMLNSDDNSILTITFQRCISRTRVICQSYGRISNIQPTSVKSKIDQPEGDKEKRMVIVSAVISAICFCLLVSGTTLFLMKKRHTRRRHKKNVKTDENEEMKLLLELDDPCDSLPSGRIEIIKENFIELVQHIQVTGSSFLDDLVSLKVITAKNKQFIESCSKDEKRAGHLLDMIVKKTNQEFQNFCEALQKSGQGYLIPKYLLTDYDYRAAKIHMADYIEGLCHIDILPLSGWSTKRKIIDIFTNLNWTFSKLDSLFHVQEQLSVTQFSELLNKIRQGKDSCTIITGEAGAGKTTFIKRTLYEIVNENKADVILPIWLRYVTDENDMFHLLQRQFPSLSCLDIYATINHLKSKSKHKWIFLDGYDELSDKRYINQIIQKQLFPNSKVIIATRPNLVTTVNALVGVNEQHLVEVKGFNKTQIKEYIKLFFESRKALASTLYDTLTKDRKDLLNMAKVPLRLEVMCQVWSFKQGLGDKMVGLVDIYNSFIQGMIEHMKQKYESFVLSEEKKQMYLNSLGNLANTWKTQTELQQSFSTKELKELWGDEYEEILRFGFLVKFHLTNSDSDRSWSFSHITIQEFFLALFIASQGTVETFSRFADRCKTVQILKNMKMVIAFICEQNPDCANSILTMIIKQVTQTAECKILLQFLLEIWSHYKNVYEISFPLP